jgi:tetratricopeptide (TPR) repeat protein
MLGNLLRHMGMHSDAIKIFLLARDLANDFEDWSQLIISYENIAKACLENKEYEKSLIAAKKMMQVTWYANSPDFEI